MLEGKKILPNKILVKRVIIKKDRTDSGIIIPDVAEEVTFVGEVILVGDVPAKLQEPIKIGDRVMYPPRAFQKVREDDIDYALLNYTDVLLFW